MLTPDKMEGSPEKLLKSIGKLEEKLATGGDTNTFTYNTAGTLAAA